MLFFVMKRWCWGFWVDLFVKTISINWGWWMRKARVCCALYLCNTKWPSTTLPCTQKKGKANVDDSSRFEKMWCYGSNSENWEWEKGKTLLSQAGNNTVKGSDTQVHLRWPKQQIKPPKMKFSETLACSCVYPPSSHHDKRMAALQLSLASSHVALVMMIVLHHFMTSPCQPDARLYQLLSWIGNHGVWHYFTYL